MTTGDFHSTDDEVWDCMDCDRRGPPERFDEVEGRSSARRCTCGGLAFEVIGFFEL